MSIRHPARALTLIVASCASAAFPGCGSGSSQPGPPPPPAVPDQPHRIAVLRLGGSTEPAEIPPNGVKDGLELFQFEEGVHFSIDVIDLGGDPDTTPDALEQAAQDGADVIVLTHPLVLAAATSHTTGGPPIAFGILGNPLALGAGESDDRHLPGLTGAYHPMPSGSLLTLVRFYLPEAARVGILFDPADPLSVAHKDALVGASAETELEVIAAEDLGPLQEPPVDAICLTLGSSPDLVAAATATEIPAFGVSEAQVRSGAVAAEAPLPDRVGVQVGRLAYRILSGESPDAIPFAPILDVEGLLNPPALERLSIPIPSGALRIARPLGGSGSPSPSD
ncbi:ABC transporter substrate binding protein [Tautonia sp. JC769]|uniref:ABC transporter substrate binding protein n=1 Tax=Tautonia sp. JC769 TaxID=3232135 RepID=UPI00345AACCB